MSYYQTYQKQSSDRIINVKVMVRINEVDLFQVNGWNVVNFNFLINFLLIEESKKFFSIFFVVIIDSSRCFA